MWDSHSGQVPANLSRKLCGGQGPHTRFQGPTLSGGPCLDKFPLRLPLQRRPGSWSKQVANSVCYWPGIGRAGQALTIYQTEL